MDPSSFIGVIWDAAKCFCGSVEREADLVFDLENNLQLLQVKRKKLDDIKKDAEAQIKESENNPEMKISHQLNGWLQRVEGIQQELKDIEAQGAQEIQNKCSSKCCPKTCMSSYKLGKNVAKMLKGVDELASEGTIFSKDFLVAHKVPAKAIEMPPDETVGLDLMFGKVWNGIETENVGVIGLYGMGGVGKTTLLKKINNELGKGSLDFDVVMWVVISKEPNIDSIMDSIRKLIKIGNDDWSQCSNQLEKATKIYGVLKQKKFVLLLDDIWEEIELKLVGVPYPKDTNFQSKMLFTTRLENICEKLHAQMKFKVEILPEKQALELFLLKVGEETLNSHPSIPKLAEEMAMECKGLPLALIVVGSAMAGVKSMEAWKSSKRNLLESSWIASDLETNVFSILKFSYDRLPDEVHKNCFLYCALFLEDYRISVFDLIDKWIGEGLLYRNMTKSIQEVRDDCESILAKLKLSCLLEISVEDGIVMIHDMLRDMALWLACDKDIRIKKVLVQGDARVVSHDDVEKWNIVERISIMGGDQWHVPSATCPNLKTLLVRECEIIKGLQNIRYMRRLKCLELRVSGILNLPVEIGDLALLEYLSLHGEIEVHKFPMELKKLRNLKFFELKIFGGNASIPLGVIPCFQLLRIFSFYAQTNDDQKSKERKLLEEVECLPKIEELRIIITTIGGFNILFESTKLQNCIYFIHLDGLDFKMNSFLPFISKMRQMQWFQLSNCQIVDSLVLDPYRFTLLQGVSISRCHSITHVTWLKYAPLLQYLHIFHCSSMEEVIKDEATEVGIVDSSTFSSLVVLYLSLLPELNSIHKMPLSFPSLKFIKVYGCPNLKKLPLDSNHAKLKLTRIQGERYWWDNLEWDDSTIKPRFQSKFQPW
ncbi:hypothetical protein QN277_011100 [Acacia crassicarpa]|uniref:NB-ARC domain-containing protein n=1 Tax=Acacia crassicarpa TaxID=499986 RepID=A0AAE1MY02_9FABA|nr:hypothetical protein QN277_011100 [Acacia crassicarpa]